MKNRIFNLTLFLSILFSNVQSQCPPPGFPEMGDTCPEAAVICALIDGYCGILDSNNINQILPGCPNDLMNNDEWMVFIAASTTITIEVTSFNCINSNNMGMQGAIYEGSCSGEAMATQCSCTEDPFILHSDNFVIGHQYFLMLDGCAGNICEYSIEVLQGSTSPVPPSTFTLEGPTVVCAGSINNVYIPNGEGLIYDWTVTPSDAGVFSNLNSANNDFITDPDFSGNFQICAAGMNGCGFSAGTSCIEIEATPGPKVSFNVSQTLCNVATIEAIFPGNAVSYLWNTGSQDSQIDIVENGIYSVSVTDDGGCVRPRSIFVEMDYAGNCVYVNGTVKEDDFDNCISDLGELPLEGWIVQMTGITGHFFATTAADGSYFLPVDPGNYIINLHRANDYWQVCQNSLSLSLPNIGMSQTVDFLANNLFDCPLMTVDIGSAIIRRCRENFYYIKYCNNGTIPASDVYIDVTFDSLLTLEVASVPYSDLGNNSYRFQVGDVPSDDCDIISIRTFSDCNTPMGYIHCTEAHIYPDTSCISPNTLWTRGDLEISGDCSNDSTQFIIENVGTGTMAEQLTYTIFRNTDIFLFNQEAPLAAGKFHKIGLPADTATWRVEVEQEPFHPLSSKVVGTVNGCTPGGLESSANSFVNDMVLPDQDEFIDIDCRENVTSYDPNEKYGSPFGYGAEHFIPNGTDIEYRLSFQNEGTDTAFSVVLRDTLTDLLDITTLRMGVSSHPYTYELVGKGILKIDFPGIRLPQLSVEEAGSQGFVEFKITAKDDLTPMTKIKNSVSIYFDYNEPVKTNTAVHTIEKPIMHTLEEVVICKGGLWDGVPYFENTTVSKTFSFAEFDSIAWTKIQVTTLLETTTRSTLCAGDSILWNGQYIKQPGIYVNSLTSQYGCDSVATLDLEIENVYADTNELILVQGEMFNGIPIFNDTVFIENLIAQNGCDSTITTNIIAVLNSGKNLAENIRLKISPNPVNSLFYVQFVLREMQNVQVEVFDVIGRKVVFASQNSIYPAGQHNVEINSIFWASGVYLVHLKMDDGTVTKKIVVHK